MFFHSAIPKKRYYTFLFAEKTLLVGKLDKKGAKLVLFSEFPLPENIITRNEIQDKEKLIQFLSEVKTKLNLAGKFVVVGISEEQCFNHTLVLPALNTDEVNQAISYQADTFLPFPYHKECLDWKLIKNLEDGKKKILISAIPKELIDSYIEAFEKAGLRPLAFESSSLSLFETLPLAERKLCIAFCYHPGNTIIFLCKDGSFEVSFLIHEDNQIGETLKKIASIYLFGKSENIPLFTCGDKILPEIEAVIQELKLSHFPLKSNLTGLPSEKESQFVLFASLLKRKIGPPVEEDTINVILESQLLKYEDVFRKRGNKKIKIILISLLFFLNIIALFSFFRLNNQIREEQNYLQRKTREINYQEKIAAYYKQALLLNKIAENEKVLRFLPDILNNYNRFVAVSGLSYAFEKKEITISGKARTRDDLLNFKKELLKQKMLKQVTIPFSSLEKDSDIEFNLIIKI